MIDQSKSDTHLVENLQLTAALGQVSEPDLMRLLHSVEKLQVDLRVIPLSDGKSIQAVSSAQSFLKIWNDQVDRILARKQMKDAYDHIHNWANEGGHG